MFRRKSLLKSRFGGISFFSGKSERGERGG